MMLRRILLLFVILFMGSSLLGCSEEKSYQTTGYVEANLFYLASPTGGYLKKLYIYNGQDVIKGQSILKLENQKILTAPARAKVIDIMYQLEELVPPNHPIVSLLIPSNMKIIFYVPEVNLYKVKLNKKIVILISDSKFYAKIIYIGNQAEYTPDNIFSENNRYRLVYKIKAELPTELQDILKEGQPVDINYE